MKERINRHESMRGWFAYELYYQMEKNEDIWVVTADLGYGMFDAIKRDYPDRFINVGASEQAGMGVAVGLALSDKIPFFYSITPFALYRPFETIRNYISQEQIPVKIIGGGRNKDYSHDGFSHWAEEDSQILKSLPGIIPLWPQTKREIPLVLSDAIVNSKPFYINLSR